MSVTDVVEQLRRAHALLSDARRATARADAAITDGAEVFATATAGSTRSEVEQINHLARASGNDVRAAHALFGQAQDLIDGYCHGIAGHGVGDPGVLSSVASSTEETTTRPPSAGPLADAERGSAPEVRYAEEIAELRRKETKISPEKVIRVGRHQQGHLVWLEVGDIDFSGQAHILRPKREREFAKKGVPLHRVVDLIFAGIERGEHIGYSGQGSEVYDVDLVGDRKRVVRRDLRQRLHSHRLSPRHRGPAKNPTAQIPEADTSASLRRPTHFSRSRQPKTRSVTSSRLIPPFSNCSTRLGRLTITDHGVEFLEAAIETLRTVTITTLPTTALPPHPPNHPHHPHHPPQPPTPLNRTPRRGRQNSAAGPARRRVGHGLSRRAPLGGVRGAAGSHRWSPRRRRRPRAARHPRRGATPRVRRCPRRRGRCRPRRRGE
ncbi:hypothetical protein AHOG_18080 [Actinoalloteichus hoggarensis]|uniref:Uncharacterized protein n=1 Tax=Actinoalloteichus hoggarensis TaxID=1470176 RepID=A0A221W693_9PSEU|nr:hypothetical protein AHOG_18080 [Actinoalloteichus hoggarensis]